MALDRADKKSLTEILFKYRSYTPVPFIIILFIFENANVWSLTGGAIVVLSGELIRLWSVSWVGSETRTTGHYGGTYLIISGPYAYIRNPLYVGNILIYLGVGIMAFAIFPYLQLAALVFFSFQYLLIIKAEEKYLFQKYDKEYTEYVSNVPRLIPRLTPYQNAGIIQPSFRLKAGLKSEKRTLQAIGFISIVILLLWFF